MEKRPREEEAAPSTKRRHPDARAEDSDESSPLLLLAAEAAEAESLQSPRQSHIPLAFKDLSLFKDIFPAGTKVYYQGRQGEIQGFNAEEEKFVVSFKEDTRLRSGATTLNLHKSQLTYLPEVGQTCLIRDLPQSDARQRYYKALILEIVRYPFYGKVSTPKVKLLWVDFGYEDQRELRQLDTILPIAPESAIAAGLRQDVVTHSNQSVGTGYYLQRK